MGGPGRRPRAATVCWNDAARSRTSGPKTASRSGRTGVAGVARDLGGELGLPVGAGPEDDAAEVAEAVVAEDVRPGVAVALLADGDAGREGGTRPGTEGMAVGRAVYRACLSGVGATLRGRVPRRERPGLRAGVAMTARIARLLLAQRAIPSSGLTTPRTPRFSTCV